MAYRRMDADDIYEIYRQAVAGEKPAQIGRNLGVDAKTVRNYLARLREHGLSSETPNLQRAEGLDICRKVLPSNQKPQPAKAELSVHTDYIRELLNDKREPLKVKTAYQVVREKFDLELSYSTFKRFVREHRLKEARQKIPLRIERKPGEEAQIDYGKVGRLYDPVSGRNRDVFAFVAVLAYSRHMYVEFVFKQDQSSFCQSIIRMLNFFGGVMRYIVIDNLKAGVIKPDLYLPKLNRSLAEVADYYKFFVSPARVRQPTDKGKVERQIPVAREMFRRFKAVDDKASLQDLNKRVHKCLIEEYGKRIHGTIGAAPIHLFEDDERGQLAALPDERFAIPRWVVGLGVHRDRFIQVDKKRYCLPLEYCGKTVDARILDNIISVYHDYKLVRQYVIGRQVVHTLPTDFPTEREKMLQDQYPRELIERARRICPDAAAYIEAVLRPHAYMNIRQAQGILRFLQENKANSQLPVICRQAQAAGYRSPKQLKKLIEYEHKQLHLTEAATSDLGKAMTRSADYYLN